MSDDVAVFEPDLAEAAEEVRAALVALRGGAPFLSGADGRLLVEWLEAGVPVAAILAALDHAAARRAKRPARTRLGLHSCRGEVAKLVGALQVAAPAPMPAGPVRWPGLASLAEELAAMEVPQPLMEAREALAQAVAGLSRGASGDEAEGVARAAMAACRAFQEAAWAALGEGRQEVLAAAATELSALAGVLSPGAFDAAVEELARDRVRAATPLVSARVVWDRMIGEG